jgi:hypothetical protein
VAGCCHADDTRCACKREEIKERNLTLGKRNDVILSFVREKYGQLTPTPMRAFQSRSHDIRMARTIKRVVHAPRSHHTCNMLLNWCVDGLGVDAIRRAQGFRSVKLGRIRVDGNDA